MEFKKKPTARASKDDVRTCALEIAREYRRRADEIEAACGVADPLAATVEGLGMGRVYSHMLFLTTALDRRNLRRGVGRYAQRAA